MKSAETKEFRQKLKDVVPAIENLMGIGGTAGMSIGVMSHGEVVLDQSLGFADVERQLRADASTRYPLASLTKAFFAATVSQLVDEGLLQWDQPLNTYIPELAFDSDPTLASRLTLIDLLSHQTGLLRLDALWLGANGQVFIPKNYTVTLCNHSTSIYPLRSKWSYNNWMYALAGEVVERVTRLSWGQVLQLKVLGKLGLSQTTAIKSEIPVNSTALPYMIMDDKTPVGVPDMAPLDGDLMSSAGGVRSSVNDMLAWGNALLSTYRTNDRQLRGIEPILSGHAFINKSIGSDELYAMGFAKVTTPTQFGKIGFNPSLVEEMPVLGDNFKPTQAFYHSGGGPGYNHCFVLVPEHQTVIIVLTNSISHGDIADWAAQTLSKLRWISKYLWI
ncbi:hypothetical protein ATERTT37_006279 [Aspergillus terreus]